MFSAMGIPACLWRRTGEIFKGNKEFADLVGVDVGRLKDGQLCIYELMSEESAVNYWEVRRQSTGEDCLPYLIESYDRNTVMSHSTRPKKQSLHLVYSDTNPTLPPSSERNNPLPPTPPSSLNNLPPAINKVFLSPVLNRFKDRFKDREDRMSSLRPHRRRVDEGGMRSHHRRGSSIVVLALRSRGMRMGCRR